MQLRTCGHDYELPTVKYDFNERNFILRSLFHILSCFIVTVHFLCLNVIL